MGALSPIPSDAPWIQTTRDRNTGKDRLSPYLSDDAQNWLLEQQARINNTPESVGDSVALTGQAASIAATPAYVTQNTGYYRVSIYGRITQAGSVSSSLAAAVGFTDGGIACTTPATKFAAVTTNTTATVLLDSVVVAADQATAINFSTTYADGGGAQSMQYKLTVIVEQVPI